MRLALRIISFVSRLIPLLKLYFHLLAWGVSCCYIATSEILAQHFDKFKYLAFALAVFGYYVGMVVWPIVSQTLLDLLGYHKAMGIMSSFHVVHVIAGVLFFSPQDGAANEDIKPETSKNIKLEVRAQNGCAQ